MTPAFHQPTPDGLFELAASDDNNHREGEARKQERLRFLRERRAIFVRRGQRALLLHLLNEDTATADDVFESIGLLPEGVDARCLGAVPGSLARAGIIKSVGFCKSTRPERHASYIQVWAIIDENAAVAWLADHSELPELPTDNEPTTLAGNEKRPTGATVGRNLNSHSR